MDLDDYRKNLLASRSTRCRSQQRGQGIWEEDTPVPRGLVLARVEGLSRLLRNESDAQPERVHADTQGQGFPVHALAHLFGFDLLPRIRNWQDLNFYRRRAEQSVGGERG